MDKIIIAGIETIVGGNLAAHLSDRYDVLGLSLGESVQIAGCETAQCPADESHTIQAWVASERPRWIVYCGPAAESSWGSEFPTTAARRLQAAAGVEPWAVAAAATNAHLTVISSDAVFTGPWMFHDEAGTDFCPTPAAQSILKMERLLESLCPEAFVVRTNAFGWSPVNGTVGFVEHSLAELFHENRLRLECLQQATPILATDLAEILEKGFLAQLQGLYHIGGAERLNPYRFGTLLASQFGCAYTPTGSLQSQEGCAPEFGRGETSLQSLRIRKALGITLPLVSEGLQRLHEQTLTGFRDQLGAGSSQLAGASA